MSSKIEADAIHQMAFEEGQPADNGDGYNFTAEEFDLFVERLLASAAPVVERQPVPDYFVQACDKFDWAPEEALKFYADGKHFDTEDGRTRILCTGAIASYALKNIDSDYAVIKGAVEPVAWKITYADDGELYRIGLSAEQAERLGADPYYKVQPLYTTPPELAELQATLFDAVAHGDEAHREWLRAAINAHFERAPMPQYVPSGKDQKIDELQATIATLSKIEDSIDARQNRIDAINLANCIDFGFDDKSVKVSQEAYSIFIAREAHYQSTIARLTAENERLTRNLETITADRDAEKNMKAKAREQRDKVTAEIERLKDGQPVPVSVVLPERMQTEPYKTIDRGSANYKAGFNACLDKVKELNQ